MYLCFVVVGLCALNVFKVEPLVGREGVHVNVFLLISGQLVQFI